MVNQSAECDGGMMKSRAVWRVVVVGLLVAASMIVGPVSGWYLADRDGSLEGLTGASWDFPINATYEDLGIIHLAGTGVTTPGNYFSYVTHHYDINHNHEARLLNSVGGEITVLNMGPSKTGLVEVTRTYLGSSWYARAYIENVLCDNNSVSTSLPYNLYIDEQYFTWYYADYVNLLVFGDTEERDLVALPPTSYWIAKDITNPALCGLYASYGTQVYPDRFHAMYRTDTPGTYIEMRSADGSVVYSGATSGYSGIYTFNITEILFDSDAPFGIYRVGMRGSSQYQDIPYLAQTLGGISVSSDASAYECEDTIIVTYSIGDPYWDTDNYQYYFKIIGPDGETVMAEDALTTQPSGDTQDIDVDGFTFPVDGYYYLALYAQDRSSLQDILLEYDIVYIDSCEGANGVDIEGVTYNAYDATVLGSCAVTVTQMGVPHVTTSNSIDGSYSVTGMERYFSIGVNASKSGWRGYPIYFTPYEEGTYNVNIPLVPTGGTDPGAWYDITGGQFTAPTHSSSDTIYYNQTNNGTAVGGIAYLSPYWMPGEGVNVTVNNATWSESTTTNSAGWYMIDEIGSGGTFTVTMSLSGYDTISDDFTVTDNEFNRIDGYLGAAYGLTVYCRDLASGGLITGDTVSVIISTGDTDTTTTGVATFSNLEYGVVDIDANCVGYYPGSTSVVMDSTKTATVYLQSSTSGSGGEGVGNYTVTVEARDLSSYTLPLIADSVTFSVGGQTSVETDGMATFVLASGTYQFRAACAGYYPAYLDASVYSNKTVVLYLESIYDTTPGLYNVTVEARDISSASLPLVTDSVTFSVNGDSTTTTSGVAYFSMYGGVYQFKAASTNYYPGTTDANIYCNKTVTVYLEKILGTPDTPVYNTYDAEIGGFTIDSSTLAGLGSVTVAISNDTFSDSTTSSSSGAYVFTGLSDYSTYNVSANKTGYTGSYKETTTGGPSSFTAVNLYLSPDYTPDPSVSSISGLVLSSPWGEPIPGANVSLSGGGGSTTTNGGGYFYVTDLTPTTAYTVTASATGYESNSESVTTGAAGTDEQVVIYLTALPTSFTLDIDVRDMVTGSLINGASVKIGSVIYSCPSGTCTANLAAGTYSCTASASGYYNATQTVNVYSDTEETIYLQKTTGSSDGAGGGGGGGSGYGLSYAPKTVRFTVQTIWGAPIEDCSVSCQGYETTAGTWDILYSCFGIEKNETPIATESMSGITDYKGDINFMMLEPVKYECTFCKTGVINQTETIYPKDDYYIILAGSFGNASWWVGSADLNEMVVINVTKGDDGTDGWINAAYTDYSGGTTGGYCYLNQSNPDDPDGEEVVIDSYTITTNNWSNNFTSLEVNGESYHVHIQPTHTTWDFERSFVVNFPKVKVNPLNLSDNELMMVATFLILFCGLLFGSISAPHAPLVMTFLGVVFFLLGWFDAVALTAVATLTLSAVLSVLTLFMVRSKQERYV